MSLFIVFEGLDGSGSTTQAKLLCQKMQENAFAVEHTSEPTENKLGKRVREVLQKKWKTSAEALQLLFCADRGDHLYTQIEPALKKGVSIISDRYILSTVAFGGLVLPREWLQQLNSQFRKPDLTFLLKVDSQKCIARIEKRGEKKELFEQQETLKKVWQNYEYLAKQDDSVYIIDGEREREIVAKEIWKIVAKRLEKEQKRN